MRWYALATGLLVIALVVAIVIAARPTPPAPTPGGRGLRLVWTFEAPRPGMVVGAPHIASDAIYLAAIHTHASDMRGAIYALDPAIGKPKWIYDREGAMLATASTPLLADEHLFVGEGLHGTSPATCTVSILTTAARGRFRPAITSKAGRRRDDLVIFPRK